jgi:hypothetical protein
MKKRVPRKSLTPTLGPRDLAKRFAEVQTLRELVRIREKEFEQRALAKRKGWSLRRRPALS